MTRGEFAWEIIACVLAAVACICFIAAGNYSAAIWAFVALIKTTELIDARNE